MDTKHCLVELLFTEQSKKIQRMSKYCSLPGFSSRSSHLCCLLLLFKGSPVHGHSFLLCDEGSQVQREAVCVIQQPCCITWIHRQQEKTVAWYAGEVSVWSNNQISSIGQTDRNVNKHISAKCADFYNRLYVCEHVQNIHVCMFILYI